MPSRLKLMARRSFGDFRELFGDFKGPPLPLVSDRWGEGRSMEKVSLDDIEYCLPADSDVGDLSGEESDIS